MLKNNHDITVIMEWSQDLIKRQGGNPVRFSEKLRNYGFNVWRIDRKKGEKPQFQSLTFKELLSINYCDVVLSRHQTL